MWGRDYGVDDIISTNVVPSRNVAGSDADCPRFVSLVVFADVQDSIGKGITRGSFWQSVTRQCPADVVKRRGEEAWSAQRKWSP